MASSSSSSDRHETRRATDAVARQLSAVEALCQRDKLRLSPLRRAVLMVVLRAAQPIGAYAILDLLQTQTNSRISPPTVYRTLQFLIDHKIIARIESARAFALITHPGREQKGLMFICDCCGSLHEIANSSLDTMIARDAEALGFRVDRQIIEMQGTCADCLDRPQADTSALPEHETIQ